MNEPLENECFNNFERVRIRNKVEQQLLQQVIDGHNGYREKLRKSLNKLETSRQLLEQEYFFMKREMRLLGLRSKNSKLASTTCSLINVPSHRHLISSQSTTSQRDDDKQSNHKAPLTIPLSVSSSLLVPSSSTSSSSSSSCPSPSNETQRQIMNRDQSIKNKSSIVNKFNKIAQSNKYNRRFSTFDIKPNNFHNSPVSLIKKPLINKQRRYSLDSRLIGPSHASSFIKALKPSDLIIIDNNNNYQKNEIPSQSVINLLA
jgi:hypothetical protein